MDRTQKFVEITEAGHNFERQALISPFGFKGGSSDFLWNTAVMLKGGGMHGCGLGTEGVLWSDQNVFFNSSDLSGSAMMFLMTSYALKKSIGRNFSDPFELFDYLYPLVYEYGKSITCLDSLRRTFALNSLVPVDCAAWQLYYRINDLKSFDELIPPNIKAAMDFRHEKLACIPLVSYGVTEEEIVKLADEGAPLLKIKIGKDPGWDKERLTRIHGSVGNVFTPYTESGKILYYLDANGRYNDLEQLMGFIAHADKIGALERIVLLEEPFAEGSGIGVSNVPVCVAADESAHSARDVANLAEIGYKAVALKPAAKTLSMTFRMLDAVKKYDLRAFCADLTVNPILVDWNKNVSARLAPLPGMKIGAFESNGAQNYAEWNVMARRHPCYGADWLEPRGGIYTLGEDFYNAGGGIFKDSAFYVGHVSKNLIK